MGCALPSSVPSATGQTFGSTGVLNLTHLWQGWVVWGVVFAASMPVYADHPILFPWGHVAAQASTPVSSASVASAPYQILARETGIHNRK